MGLITKILTWLRANGASVLGAFQAVLKAIKELLTAVVNLLSIFLPAAATSKIVDSIRAVVNTIDGGVEFVKVWLLRL